MIINPSALIRLIVPTTAHEKRLEELYGKPDAVWDHVPLAPDTDNRWNAYCYCRGCRPKLPVQTGDLDAPMENAGYWTVVLVPEVFLGGTTSQVKFWFGKCSKCGTISWSCDNWIWVSWLSDFEMLHTVLNGAGIKYWLLGHANVKRGVKQITLIEKTEFVFRDNEIIKINGMDIT